MLFLSLHTSCEKGAGNGKGMQVTAKNNYKIEFKIHKETAFRWIYVHKNGRGTSRMQKRGCNWVRTAFTFINVMPYKHVVDLKKDWQAHDYATLSSLPLVSVR